MSRPNLMPCAIALAGLAVAAAAFGAEPASPSAEPSARSTAASAETLICRDRLRPGSHIAMRTCLTAAQWAAAQARGSLRGARGPGGPGAAWNYAHEGVGPWGQVSTTAQSVGVNVFTAR